MNEKKQDRQTSSIWMENYPGRIFPTLSGNIDAVDVCVIGAGITGLSTALLLLQNGKSVIVLDDGAVGGGDTCRTTAHITAVLDSRYFEIAQMHGKENAALVAESHISAINKIESIIKLFVIDCDFKRVDGYLFAADSDQHTIKDLKREMDAVQELPALSARLVDQLPFAPNTPAIKFSRQAQFHILKYLNALCDGIEEMGGRIFSNEHVVGFEDGENVRIMTRSGKQVIASNLVVATHSPISDWVKVHTKQAPYRSYAIGVPVPKDSFPLGLYWDTAEPYHYVRVQTSPSTDEDMLIVGGEDHRTGEANDAEKRFARLEEWMHERLEVTGRIEYKWSAQVYEPADGLGYIGLDPAHSRYKNVFVSSGASGVGMTHGTISAMLLTDLISGVDNPWREIYSPARKPLGAVLDYLKENINTAGQYARLAAPGEVSGIESLAPGEGAVIRRGLDQIAAYKDEQGRVHELSAHCPHLGATLCWNSCEKSWDCSAHGSRFDATGQVINPPANSDLKPHNESQSKHPKAS